jgi:hypothetical protein
MIPCTNKIRDMKALEPLMLVRPRTPRVPGAAVCVEGLMVSTPLVRSSFIVRLRGKAAGHKGASGLHEMLATAP